MYYVEFDDKLAFVVPASGYRASGREFDLTQDK